MNYRHRSEAGYIVIWLSIFSMVSLSSARAACYSTPAAAVDSMKPGSTLLPLQEGGYRVTSIQSDPVLSQRWAMIASCEHPERPVFSTQIEISGAAEPFLSKEPQSVRNVTHETSLVHAGDTVRLWRQEAALRIELAGVAEENGSLGKLIRVRLLRRNTDDQSTQAEFAGIVRGNSDVEMQP